MMKFTENLRNNSGFSLIEVLVAIFIASLIVFSSVEVYRYVLSIVLASRGIEKNIKVVSLVYNKISFGEIKVFDGFYTNIENVDIFIKLTNTLSTNPLISDIIIYSTNDKYTFSVLTSVF
ncbi:MAG: type IV pilus modification PilV family protein [Brevinematia bacterium]